MDTESCNTRLVLLKLSLHPSKHLTHANGFLEDSSFLISPFSGLRLEVRQDQRLEEAPHTLKKRRKQEERNLLDSLNLFLWNSSQENKLKTFCGILKYEEQLLKAYPTV